MLTLPRRRARGFTLVELMVALVLGLIVAGAVLAMVLAIIRSNRATLQTTRLNQELRATLSAVAGDLRRARSVEDPLTSALDPDGNPFRVIRTSNANCVIYGYAGAAGGPWHIVRLEGERVVLEGFTNDDPPANCDPGGAETPLGSEQVVVTGLTFSPSTTVTAPPAAPLPTDENVVREITITITGHLRDDDASLAVVQRTMSQTVYVRSVGTGI